MQTRDTFATSVTAILENFLRKLITFVFSFFGLTNEVRQAILVS